MEHAHSGFRWIALILIVLTIIKAFKGIKNAEEYTSKHKMLALGTLIFFHLQILIGFSLLFSSAKTAFFDMTQPFRFFTIEHPLMMIIAVTLVTMGYSKAKKESSARLKFRKILIFYSVAILITLIAIPWPFRGVLEGGMF